MNAVRSPRRHYRYARKGRALDGPTAQQSPSLLHRESSAALPSRLHSFRAAIKPVAHLLASLAMLAATLVSIEFIHLLMPSTHPPVPLLVLPGIAAGMLFGRLYGLTILLTALVAARLLYFPTTSGLEFRSADDILGFASIGSAMIGSSIVAVYAHKMSRDAKLTETRCHNFNRDVLFAVTSGRLVLCDASELMTLAGGLTVDSSTVGTPSELHDVREAVRQAVRSYLLE